VKLKIIVLHSLQHLVNSIYNYLNGSIICSQTTIDLPFASRSFVPAWIHHAEAGAS